jgi:beta-glucanase (GH16 family)
MRTDSREFPARRPNSFRWALAAAVAGVLLIGAGAYGMMALTGARLPSASTPDGPALADASGSPGAAPQVSAGASAGPSSSATSSPKPSGRPAGAAATTCTIAGGTAGCPAAPPVAAASGKRWKLAFDEEFNGSDYDHSKLTPCFDWNTGECTASFNSGRERYLPSQVTVSNGTAKLTAAPLSPAYPSSACQNGTCTYKAGLLSTARPNAGNGSDYLYKFTYGYVESRIKFPATQGFFTAFWMLPADPSYNYKYETDILEMLGDDPTTMYMTYSYNNRSSSYPVNTGKFHNGACATKDYSKNFVRMGLDWQPDHIAWYIDGKKCGQFTNAAQISNVPMQLILHMMVDNNWQRRWNVGLKDPTLTRNLEVDYIRVYQQVPR